MRRATILVLAATLACALPAAAEPAIDGDHAFVVGYMSNFVKSCVKQVHADPPVPAIACACMAALTASRVTKDELVASKGDPARLAQTHPEVNAFLPLCAATAKDAR